MRRSLRLMRGLLGSMLGILTVSCSALVLLPGVYVEVPYSELRAAWGQPEVTEIFRVDGLVLAKVEIDSYKATAPSSAACSTRAEIEVSGREVFVMIRHCLCNNLCGGRDSSPLELGPIPPGTYSLLYGRPGKVQAKLGTVQVP